MRTYSESELADAVIARMDQVNDPRFKQILASLVRHLHAFAREVELTEAEWFEGIKFLTAVGQKCDDKRQEFILLSDVLGLSSLVDMVNHRLPAGATESTVLGPFFVHGAPEFEADADLTRGAKIPGEPTYVSGRITAVDGKPVADATIDVWQARANGVYDIQEPDGEFELRGRIKAGTDGRYAFRTFKPTFYGVPTDGPVGMVLDKMGRHPMRPAHLHMIVNAPGYQQVVTHVFVQGDPYLESDTVFAVKPSLVAEFRKVDSAAEAKTLGLPNPFLRLDWDIKLAPAGAGKTRATIAASDTVKA
jgi:protocatechuate 3,4-dioxygenase beta subunit